MAPPPTQQTEAAQARRIAVVVAVAAVLWVLVEALAGQFNWPPRYILLADLCAAAAFIWAMIAALRIWRKRPR